MCPKTGKKKKKTKQIKKTHSQLSKCAKDKKYLEPAT